MPQMHYTKSGNLDMRYSSSKAAVSSGFSSGSGFLSSSGYSGSSVSSGNYACMEYPNSSSPTTSTPSNSTSGIVLKRDGTPDMRYNSSKNLGFSTTSTPSNSTSGINLKRDGTPDMRYNSSKNLGSSGNDAASSTSAASTPTKSTSGIVLKRDGTPDMRYNSSKTLLASKLNQLTINAPRTGSIPDGIPVTKYGLPDMRTTAAKEWVKEQALCISYIPDWVPRLKDGAVDTKKAVTQEYLKHSACNYFEALQSNDGVNQRERYYEQKMSNDKEFQRMVETVRNQDIQNVIPRKEACCLPNSCHIKEELRAPYEFQLSSADQISMPNVDKIEYSELNLGVTETEIGRGFFGLVLKGFWNGKNVAVKRLHLSSSLSVREKNSFMKEIIILGWLGEHENLVRLHAYTLSPLSLVMEYVGLGNLSQVLHYSVDPAVEAKISDGRIKKKLVLGIVAGMIQLHAVDVVHGDLKPQNILVTQDYVAKITDFGLATLRGKTGATIASQNLTEDEFVIGGTGGYMAPELLNSTTQPELSIDVYSYGIILNEIIVEEEPFSDQYKNFALRGPFAAVNHASQGHRPKMSEKTPDVLKAMIKNCWAHNPKIRQTFTNILNELTVRSVKFPNSC